MIIKRYKAKGPFNCPVNHPTFQLIKNQLHFRCCFFDQVIFVEFCLSNLLIRHGEKNRVISIIKLKYLSSPTSFLIITLTTVDPTSEFEFLAFDVNVSDRKRRDDEQVGRSVDDMLHDS